MAPSCVPLRPETCVVVRAFAAVVDRPPMADEVKPPNWKAFSAEISEVARFASVVVVNPFKDAAARSETMVVVNMPAP